jgi:hypothetical protein
MVFEPASQMVNENNMQAFQTETLHTEKNGSSDTQITALT